MVKTERKKGEGEGTRTFPAEYEAVFLPYEIASAKKLGEFHHRVFLFSRP